MFFHRWNEASCLPTYREGESTAYCLGCPERLGVAVGESHSGTFGNIGKIEDFCPELNAILAAFSGKVNDCLRVAFPRDSIPFDSLTPHQISRSSLLEFGSGLACKKRSGGHSPRA